MTDTQRRNLLWFMEDTIRARCRALEEPGCVRLQRLNTPEARAAFDEEYKQWATRIQYPEGFWEFMAEYSPARTEAQILGATERYFGKP